MIYQAIAGTYDFLLFVEPFLGTLFWEKIEICFTDNILRGFARQFAGTAGICKYKYAIDIFDENLVGQGIDNGTQEVAFTVKLLTGLDLVGDIVHYADKVGQLPLLVEYR